MHTLKPYRSMLSQGNRAACGNEFKPFSLLKNEGVLKQLVVYREATETKKFVFLSYGEPVKDYKRQRSSTKIRLRHKKNNLFQQMTPIYLLRECSYIFERNHS